MAHFAKIGMNGKVLQVVTLDDKDMLDVNGSPNERVGQEYLETHNNWPAEMWIQTSYNTFRGEHRLGGTPLRGNFASIGCIWDEENNIFWPPKPYPSWVKNSTDVCWQSPIGDAPALTAEQTSQNEARTNNWVYEWNETNQSWDLTDLDA